MSAYAAVAWCRSPSSTWLSSMVASDQPSLPTSHHALTACCRAGRLSLWFWVWTRTVKLPGSGAMKTGEPRTVSGSVAATGRWSRPGSRLGRILRAVIAKDAGKTRMDNHPLSWGRVPPLPSGRWLVASAALRSPPRTTAAPCASASFTSALHAWITARHSGGLTLTKRTGPAAPGGLHWMARILPAIKALS
eukprot:1207100-Rhodomonas_salina.2